MIRNIVHRRIFVRDSQKTHKPFQGKRVNQQAPRKDFEGKWSHRRQITNLSVSRNNLQYFSFNLVNIPQNFMTGKQRNSELSRLRQMDFKNLCVYQVELIDKPDQAFVPSP